jgi:hypothetical protein
LRKEIADVEMFTGDNTKLLSTFRSNNEFQHFMHEKESNRVRSTARLPNGRNPTIPTAREVPAEKEVTAFDDHTLGYTMVASSQHPPSNEKSGLKTTESLGQIYGGNRLGSHLKHVSRMDKFPNPV